MARNAVCLSLALLVAMAVRGFAAQEKPTTTSTISISPNPIVVGTMDATITAETKVSGTSNYVSGGRLQIERALDASGNHVACEAATSYGEPESEQPTDGVLTLQEGKTFPIGSYGYRAHFVPASSGYAESKSACVNLDVIPPPCTGLQISAALASGTGVPTPGSSWDGGFVIEVKNCGPGTAYGVTAQGGTSGWTKVRSYSTYTGKVGIRKDTGKTQILLWEIGDMEEGAEATLTVNLSGEIKASTPPGTVLYLNGPWSAQSGGVKTDYTERITVTVVTVEE